MRFNKSINLVIILHLSTFHKKLSVVLENKINRIKGIVVLLKSKLHVQSIEQIRKQKHVR